MNNLYHKTLPLSTLFPSTSTIFQANSFDTECRELPDGNCLHILNIEKIDDKLRKAINENIVKICSGNVDTDVAIIKKRLLNFLENKDETKKMGAIAEFFTHLYLNEIGFKQECLFLNLEEGSIKKGFDGYYSLEGQEWIYESKSGNISTPGITHRKKLKESYDDLSKKISGKVDNNPWENAYHHAGQMDVRADSKILENLRKLSDDFVMEKFKEIKDFNIMPGSTIFLGGNWQAIDADELEQQILQLIGTLKFKKIHLICVNKSSLNLFKGYLES